ncbi:hypothetical protein T261_2862 [Streptomyces lydicus]|nr:hypothetical protein T261_2862 [Streptomyces lydicus]
MLPGPRGRPESCPQAVVHRRRVGLATGPGMDRPSRTLTGWSSRRG